MDQAAHHEQELQVQHDLERVIAKATHEPITKDEAALLSWAAGITFKPQEKSNGTAR